MKPFISVVIPTYNHAKFLNRALKSVLEQNYDNWEAIVIDNHSCDDTDEVVSNLEDDRIKLLKIHNNDVIAASRNLGIKEAKGDWVAFLDSDDYWYSTKFETVMVYLTPSERYDVVSTDELLVNQNNGEKKILRYGPYSKHFYKTMLLYGNRLSPSATLVRKSFLNDYKLLFRENRELITVEDYDLWLRLALNGASFKFIHSVEGEFTVHGGNNSSKLVLHNNNLKYLLKDHIFNIQRFAANSEILWNMIKKQYQLTALLKSKEKILFLDKYLEICKIIYTYPVYTLINFSIKIKKLVFIKISVNFFKK
jgi:glycosyltransferase involved in cell wall biosynthesis